MWMTELHCHDHWLRNAMCLLTYSTPYVIRHSSADC